MTAPTRQPTAPAAACAACSGCQSVPASHLITTPAGTSLVCSTCRPIDLLPAAGPTDPAGALSPAVTR